MNNITITFSTMLQFFGALAVIAGGVKVIVSALDPYKKVTDKLKKHDDLFADDKQHLDKLDKSFDKIADEQKIQGKALMALISHIVTGNDIEKLKKIYTEMVNHYIDL